MVRDIVELGVDDTPQYDPYEEGLQNDETFPMLSEEPEVIPEWWNQDVNAEVLLPRGDRIARGKVVHQKQDAYGNPFDRSSQNLTLDKCFNEVGFPGGEITELPANIIAESMYTQCDVDVNEYLLLEAFICHRKDGSALSVEGQKMVAKE